MLLASVIVIGIAWYFTMKYKGNTFSITETHADAKGKSVVKITGREQAVFGLLMSRKPTQEQEPEPPKFGFRSDNVSEG